MDSMANLLRVPNRRSFLGMAGALGMMAAARARAAQSVALPLPGGPAQRDLTTAFPSAVATAANVDLFVKSYQLCADSGVHASANSAGACCE